MWFILIPKFKVIYWADSVSFQTWHNLPKCPEVQSNLKDFGETLWHRNFLQILLQTLSSTLGSSARRSCTMSPAPAMWCIDLLPFLKSADSSLCSEGGRQRPGVGSSPWRGFQCRPPDGTSEASWGSNNRSAG